VPSRRSGVALLRARVLHVPADAAATGGRGPGSRRGNPHTHTHTHTHAHKSQSTRLLVLSRVRALPHAAAPLPFTTCPSEPLVRHTLTITPRTPRPCPPRRTRCTCRCPGAWPRPATSRRPGAGRRCAPSAALPCPVVVPSHRAPIETDCRPASHLNADLNLILIFSLIPSVGRDQPAEGAGGAAHLAAAARVQGRHAPALCARPPAGASFALSYFFPGASLPYLAPLSSALSSPPI
jgi:hypothetical protein